MILSPVRSLVDSVAGAMYRAALVGSTRGEEVGDCDWCSPRRDRPQRRQAVVVDDGPVEPCPGRAGSAVGGQVNVTSPGIDDHDVPLGRLG